MNKILSKMVLFSAPLTYVLLFIYSYTQIDLNLTLSTNAWYQQIQKDLIWIGYYNRPLSATIFTSLIIVLFVQYCVVLYLLQKKSLRFSELKFFIVSSVGLLFLAYPSFSHDLFNYMFDARIVTEYHANPYMHKAIDYPLDLWIRFMHWTHRTYPYGPVWLFITVPFSFIGFGKFVFTLISFKLMFVLFHLGNIYFVHKILQTYTKTPLIGTAFYALNPLILIESLVSPHNEVMMLFFLLMFIYFGIQRKQFLPGLIALALSVGVKFVTLSLLPFYAVNYFFKQKTIHWKLHIMLYLLVIPLIGEIIYREPYPWYFMLLIGVGALLSSSVPIYIIISGISMGALLRYVPYLYEGSYPEWVGLVQLQVFYVSLGASIVLIALYLWRNKRVLTTTYVKK